MNAFRLIGILCIFLSSAAAAEKASRESVEKLMELTEASKMVDAMYGQVGQMFEGIGAEMGMTEADRPAFDKYMNRVMGLMKKEMSWDRLKEPTIDIYVRNFTEEEVRGLIDFYGSDIGRSMIQKMPIVMQESMGISQAMLRDALPKIHALAQEMQKELEAGRGKSASEE